MKLSYTLSENDFLAFQLFYAQHSPAFQKKKRNGWIILTFMPLILMGIFFWENNHWPAVYCGIIGLLTGIFYPKFFDWKQRKNLVKFVQHAFQELIDQPVTLELHPKHLVTENKTGKGKVKYSDIEGINETAVYFFIATLEGYTIIVPKSVIKDTFAFRKIMEKSEVLFKSF